VLQRFVTVVLAAVVLASCGVESGSESPQDASTSPGQETSVTPSETPSPTPSTGGEGPAAAINDLAKRLNVEAAEISVVSAEEVTWPDGSIGCPEPGMVYTQALVPGSLIVLEAGGKRYEYHGAAGKPLFYCENPKPPVR
jgi:hypothetical protein